MSALESLAEEMATEMWNRMKPLSHEDYLEVMKLVADKLHDELSESAIEYINHEWVDLDSDEGGAQ